MLKLYIIYNAADFFFFPKLSAISTQETSYQAAIFDYMEHCDIINNSVLSLAIFKLARKAFLTVCTVLYC